MRPLARQSPSVAEPQSQQAQRALFMVGSLAVSLVALTASRTGVLRGRAVLVADGDRLLRDLEAHGPPSGAGDGGKPGTVSAERLTGFRDSLSPSTVRP